MLKEGFFRIMENSLMKLYTKQISDIGSLTNTGFFHPVALISKRRRMKERENNV
jgi:hypothetical protein